MPGLELLLIYFFASFAYCFLDIKAAILCRLGDSCKSFVYKTKEDVDTTMVLERLPHVTFSDESNQVQGGFF